MKLTITILLFAAISKAESIKNDAFEKTEKRALSEGNVSLNKRAPILPTANPSVTPGIEYAETKQSLPDKSPSQRVYATPVPQLAKISDLLSGQGPSFQSAIDSHLFSPVSVYQPRIATPTTYEVSAPVASQEAYTEHRVSYQPNSIQYNPQQTYTSQDSRQPNTFLQPQQILPPTQVYQQQLFRPIAQSNYQPQQLQFAQQNYQPQQLQYNSEQAIHYSGPQIRYLDSQQSLQTERYRLSPNNMQQYNLAQQVSYSEPQQPIYVQQQPIQNIQSVPNTLTYSAPQGKYEIVNQQKDLNYQSDPNIIFEKQQYTPQIYNPQSQGAVSFASFSHNQPTPTIIHHQYQPAQNIQQTSNIALPERNDLKQVGYVNQGSYQIQPQTIQLQGAHQSQVNLQNPDYKNQPLASAPTFPPVQYFGKHAQSIFTAQHQ